MDASDQRPAQSVPAQPVPAQPVAAQPVAAPFAPPSVPAADARLDNTGTPLGTLPTMADLDRLAADLDRVDLTLVEIDDPARVASH